MSAFLVLVAAVALGVLLGGGLLQWLQQQNANIFDLFGFISFVITCFLLLFVLYMAFFNREMAREILQAILAIVEGVRASGTPD